MAPPCYQERQFQREQGTAVGRSVLYFGCRNSNEDYIYKDELATYLADGTLDALYTAFSREQTEKVYVQHRLRYVSCGEAVLVRLERVVASER